ncbi:MAG: hypothetical protein P8R54_33150 [Myxococcota bacterium]|nr:hypothetical protein [Myxococcota bacterium]
MSFPWLLSGHLSGCRIRLHWSLLLGLMAAFLFPQTSDAVVGYLLIITAHIAGHYLLARRGGLSTVGIDLNAVGGSLHHRGEAARLHYTLAGAGGVLGQGALVVLVTMAAAALSLDAEGPLYEVLTTYNLILMALNLLPLSGTDAASVYALPGAVVGRLEEKLTYLQIQEVEAQRADWQELIDRDGAAAQVPSPSPATPIELEALLAQRDAEADAGITDAFAAEVSSLLAGVWSSEE